MSVECLFALVIAMVIVMLLPASICAVLDARDRKKNRLGEWR